MPALVNKSDGSSGIRDEEGQRLQPLFSKKLRYFSRISALVMYFIGYLSFSMCFTLSQGSYFHANYIFMPIIFCRLCFATYALPFIYSCRLYFSAYAFPFMCCRICISVYAFPPQTHEAQRFLCRRILFLNSVFCCSILPSNTETLGCGEIASAIGSGSPFDAGIPWKNTPSSLTNCRPVRLSK